MAALGFGAAGGGSKKGKGGQSKKKKSTGGNGTEAFAGPIPEPATINTLDANDKPPLVHAARALGVKAGFPRESKEAFLSQPGNKLAALAALDPKDKSEAATKLRGLSGTVTFCANKFKNPHAAAGASGEKKSKAKGGKKK